MATIALFAGLLTIYSMVRVWSAAFWTAHPEGTDPDPATLDDRLPALLGPLIVLGLVVVAMGVFPQPFVDVADRAAQQLLAPDLYLTTILGVAE